MTRTEPSTIAEEGLVGQLLDRCLDWDGSTMPDGAETRIPIKCGEIRDVASGHTALLSQIGEAATCLDEIAHASWRSVNGDDPVKRIKACAKRGLAALSSLP